MEWMDIPEWHLSLTNSHSFTPTRHSTPERGLQPVEAVSIPSNVCHFSTCQQANMPLATPNTATCSCACRSAPEPVSPSWSKRGVLSDGQLSR